MLATRKECADTDRAEAVDKELGYFVRNVGRCGMELSAAGVSSLDRGSSKPAARRAKAQLQTVGHVLGRARSGKYPGSALPQRQRSPR